MVPAREAGRTAGAVGPAVPRAGQTSYAQEAATLTGAIDAAVQLLARQPDNAQMALETVALTLERARLASSWNTAQLHAVAAQIFAALGRSAAADAHRALALAMNPHAMRRYPVVPPV